MVKFLITGGAGFIGHHMVEHILKTRPDDKIVIVDKLTYACKGLDRLRSFNALTNPNVTVITHDLCVPFSHGISYEIEKFGDKTPVDIIIHMAAETHVDNSIQTPVDVIQNNVMSTVNLLEYARTISSLKLFFYFSTDEVFGPAPGTTLFKEWDRHKPTNPYSASKSASEQICVAYENTYKIPLMVVNVMNVIGERQHIEKFIPKIVKSILTDNEILIHSDKECKNAGTRFYIHARNVASAVMFLMENGTIGEKYNIAGEKETSNLEIVQQISEIMGMEAKTKLINFHESRPGHDLRYGLDDSKLTAMGWKHPVDFKTSLEHTVKWMVANPSWLEW